jgi:hypothetical protein
MSYRKRRTEEELGWPYERSVSPLTGTEGHAIYDEHNPWIQAIVAD